MAGTITKRGERTWRVRIDMERDPLTGRRARHSKTIHGTKKDAEAYMHKVLLERDMGTWIEPSTDTVSAYLDRWFKEAAVPSMKSGSADLTKEYLARYLKPALGARRLDKLTPLDIQALYSALPAPRECKVPDCKRCKKLKAEGKRHVSPGLSPSTILRVHDILRSALGQAVKWGLLRDNPASRVETPKRRKREMLALSPADAAKFLAAAAKDEHAVLWSLLLVTGMRPGEALALRWQDVDLKANVATIRRTLTWRPKGKFEFGDPKTEGSVRQIPLPDRIIADLRRHSAKQAEGRLKLGERFRNHDLVFCTELGTPHRPENLSRRHLKEILRLAGLPSAFRLYDLRHSCATLLLADGVHPKIVAERLGHSSVVLTLNTYSHVTPTMQQQATDRLGAMLFGGG